MSITAATSLGQTGQEAVHSRFHADAMAAGTLAVYEQYL